MLVAIELDAHHLAAVDHPERWRVHGGDALPVARVKHLPHAVRQPRRRVLDARGSRRSRWHPCAARDELVEAGERLGDAVDVKYFDARIETIGAEDPEVEGFELEGAAPCTVGAGPRHAHEERVMP